VSVSAKSTDGGILLSEAEKEQLLTNIKTEFENVISEQEDFENTIEQLKN
jgi:hypothetical protein